MKQRHGRLVRFIGFAAVLFCLIGLAPAPVQAAPYAAIVIDGRTGETLYATNADTRLHPASLTKMLTLYIAFEAIERGEISLDTKVKISRHAASQPPSKLGLKAGQTIALRYLIRAAAVKSANDAATAIGEAIAGSEPAFATRMNRTAKALGMKNSTFKNANGLTASGHLSTARDMTTLGRRLFFDFPQYYNIFSRRSTDAGLANVANTNRRFLDAYKGADGIKTGYTSAAGFNLTASAERGSKRIIATVFGGKSTAHRNAKMAELLDLGFGNAPANVAVKKPPEPQYDAVASAATATQGNGDGRAAGKTIRLITAVKSSPRPKSRPGAVQLPAEIVVAMQEDINAVLAEVAEAAAPAPAPVAVADAVADAVEVAAAAAVPPAPRPETLEAAAVAALAAVDATAGAPPVVAAAPEPAPEPEPAAVAVAEAAAEPEAGTVVMLAGIAAPRPRPDIVPAAAHTPAPAVAPEAVAALAPAPRPRVTEVVTRISTSGGRHWGINLGRFPSRMAAENALMKTSLAESVMLGDSLRKVVNRKGGFDANFLGLTQDQADLACRRLQARAIQCFTMGP